MPKKSSWSHVCDALRIIDPGNELQRLSPVVRDRFYGLVLVLALRGYGRLVVVSGRRSYDEQAALYGRGRTREECVAAGVDPRHADPARAVVTWCRPEDSMHVKGLAVDLAVQEYVSESWGVIGSIAEGLGFRWGGRWRVRDYGHFEFSAGLGKKEVR